MAERIFIDDLAQPVLNEAQKMALAYGETLDVELSRRSIMAEAERDTGLDNWGAEDFIERLDLLCDEWGGDSGLTGIGRLSLRNKLLQHASSRLLIEDQLACHPGILNTPIERPIIVAGLPRSGTTHLLNLMAADTRLRSLPLWLSYEPVPRLGEKVIDGVDPRYQRCAEAWQSMQAVSPLLAAMHPMNPDHIHEELELMGPNFGSYNYEWLNYSPRWRDHYYSEDQSAHYQYMKKVLQLLTWQARESNQPTRWVLKCPQHLEQLPVLRKVFPDATLVLTQRDPVAVIQSAVTMLAYGQRINRREVMTTELLDYWCDRVEHLLRAAVRDRAVWPESQSMDLPFSELTRDDMAAVEKIYRLAELPMTAAAREQIRQFSEQHSENYGRVAYDLERHFATSAEALAPRFSFYTDLFPA